jgi:hypothetical protein
LMETLIAVFFKDKLMGTFSAVFFVNNLKERLVQSSSLIS